QQRRGEGPAGQAGQVGGDLAGALDGLEGGGDQAAAVGGHGGAGVEQGDQRGDVLGFPGPFEGADDGGLAGWGGCGGGGGAGAGGGAGGGGQVGAGGGGAAGDGGDVGEGVAEHVVQDERDPLCGGHRLQRDQERHGDRLIQCDPVGRVGAAGGRGAGP